MSKKRKQLYATVLIIGAIALLVDRAMRVSSPQAAHAATARSLEALGVETSVDRAASVAAAPFPGSLPESGAIEELRDVFALAEHARRRMLNPDPDDPYRRGASGRRGKPRVKPAALFEQEHILNAVMVGDGTSFAIIDGKWFRVGDRLDDCELTRITGTRVVWECADRSVTLSVIESSAALARDR